MEFKHRGRIQKRYDGLQCYGRRIELPKKTIVSVYTFFAIIVPVVIPLPLAFVLQKVLPRWIRM